MLRQLQNVPLGCRTVKYGGEGRWWSQPPVGTLLHPAQRGSLPAGLTRGGFSRRHDRPKRHSAQRRGSETRPRTPLARTSPGRTVSLLKRTDTRAGNDPPSSLRAASIAGTSPVTSRCHLHGTEARGTRAPRDARRRTGNTSRIPAPGQPCASPTSTLTPPPQGRADRSEVTSGAAAAGRCSPTSLGPCFPSAPDLQTLARWPNRSAVPLLACSASSRSLPVPQPLKPQVNKPRMLLPSAGFWCFPLSTGSAFSACCVHKYMGGEGEIRPVTARPS